MTSLTRSLFAAALAAALTAGLAGCQSATSTVVGAGFSSAAPPARVVYLAEGGSVTGTALHAPACQAGCPLSGDGTTSLWDMTWSTWNPDGAAGAGTEKLDDCTPNCAAGTLLPVPVKVTLSRPVMICTGGPGTWFWTRVTFTWPAGLPEGVLRRQRPAQPVRLRRPRVAGGEVLPLATRALTGMIFISWMLQGA